VVTTPDRLDWFSYLKRLHVQVSQTLGQVSSTYLVGLIVLSSVMQLFSRLTVDWGLDKLVSSGRSNACNPLAPRIDKNLGNPCGEKGVCLYACGS
jgi:hypothetical protein